jgi:hypothetical protein
MALTASLLFSHGRFRWRPALLGCSSILLLAAATVHGFAVGRSSERGPEDLVSRRIRRDRVVPIRTPVVQEAGEILEELKSTLDQYKSAGYYTADQLQELATLSQASLARVSNPEFRQKLLTDIKNYVVLNHSAKALVSINPSPDAQNPVEVLRPPSAWDLYKYELSERLDLAIEHPKSKDSATQIQDQVGEISSVANVRLASMLDGPGADEYRSAWIEKFKQQLRYYAESDLESLFPRPLSAAELKELEHQLATFALPADSRAKPGENPNIVRIDDPKHPPYEADLITSFGMLSVAQVFLYKLAPDPELKNEKYMRMVKRMTEDLNSLSHTLKGENGIEVPGDASARTMPGSNVIVRRTTSAERPGSLPNAATRAKESEPSPRGDLRGHMSWVIALVALILISGIVLALRRLPKPGASKPR